MTGPLCQSVGLFSQSWIAVCCVAVCCSCLLASHARCAHGTRSLTPRDPCNSIRSRTRASARLYGRRTLQTPSPRSISGHRRATRAIVARMISYSSTCSKSSPCSASHTHTALARRHSMGHTRCHPPYLLTSSSLAVSTFRNDRRYHISALHIHRVLTATTAHLQHTAATAHTAARRDEPTTNFVSLTLAIHLH